MEHSVARKLGVVSRRRGLRASKKRLRAAVVIVTTLVAVYVLVQIGEKGAAAMSRRREPNAGRGGRRITMGCPYFQSTGSCSNQSYDHMDAYISNWRENFDDIILLVDDLSHCPDDPRITCLVHGCPFVQYHRPSVPCLMKKLEDSSHGDILVFGNDDIMYSGVKNAVNLILRSFDAFFAVGSRMDVEENQFCTFLQDKKTPLSLVPHPPCAVDYFIFTHGEIKYEDIPQFMIGSWKWDNFLLDRFIRAHEPPVVDASQAIRAIHPDSAQRTTQTHSEVKKSVYNANLYNAYYASIGDEVQSVGDIKLGSINCAPYYISDDVLLHQESAICRPHELPC